MLEMVTLMEKHTTLWLFYLNRNMAASLKECKYVYYFIKYTKYIIICFKFHLSAQHRQQLINLFQLKDTRVYYRHFNRICIVISTFFFCRLLPSSWKCYHLVTLASLWIILIQREVQEKCVKWIGKYTETSMSIFTLLNNIFWQN